MKTKLLLTVLFSIGIIGISNAQVGQMGQKERIHQGVRSGELTRFEAARLHREQVQTHRDIRRAKADGVISHREGMKIRHDEKRNNRNIYRLKHNHRERRF